jgi:hypothetical protein
VAPLAAADPGGRRAGSRASAGSGQDGRATLRSAPVLGPSISSGRRLWRYRGAEGVGSESDATNTCGSWASSLGGTWVPVRFVTGGRPAAAPWRLRVTMVGRPRRVHRGGARAGRQVGSLRGGEVAEWRPRLLAARASSTPLWRRAWWPRTAGGHPRGMLDAFSPDTPLAGYLRAWLDA